jgi:hypothetical protein
MNFPAADKIRRYHFPAFRFCAIVVLSSAVDKILKGASAGGSGQPRIRLDSWRFCWPPYYWAERENEGNEGDQ